MPPKDLDQDWKRFGELDPYYAVLTSDQYKQENLTDEALNAFFVSGEQVVSQAIAAAQAHFDETFQPQRGLDFGCGTARLTIPLARRCESVVGVDVSEHMLEKARLHSQQAGVENIDFVLGDDTLSNVTGSFDFILSYIVFQHIPTARGEVIFRQLLARLRENGIGCIHMPYLREMSRIRRMGYWLRVRVPLVHQLLNRLTGRPASYPLMQYNAYNLNRMLHLLHQAQCDDIHIQLFANGDRHSTYNSLFLYFRKQLSANVAPKS